MLKHLTGGRKRDWVFCVVTIIICIVLWQIPTGLETDYAQIDRVKVEILEVDNTTLEPLGIVYAGTQKCNVRVLSGEYEGVISMAYNHQNSSLDKDKLFCTGEKGLAMIQAVDDGYRITLIDHYRLDTEALLFGLFGILLILFGGISGCGALISLVLSIMLVWKVLIPALLAGMSPIWVSLGMVLVLTAMIDLLVAGFSKKALVAMLGSLQGTLLTCVLAVVFGNMLKLDGGSLPYVVPLLSQSTMTLNLRELFYAMVFIANSGALMDLSMDISCACDEICYHKPEIQKWELLKSGFAVGKSVIGTMTTTLMLAYSGSYLSMLMYFAGQGTPVMDIVNLKYVASEVLITLVGSFGLVTVAPFTALTAMAFYGKGKMHQAQMDA
ncbi:MAG: YibE/F family protein [Clostridiales bacterium]|nr:YibE/F family protein [Clostridiales bacterium]